MSDSEHQEYDDEFITLLEAVWGEGYMSPGGPEEMDNLLAGVDLAGARALDIGCGTGGPSLHLARQGGAQQVTGIDIEELLIRRCEALARKYGLQDRVQFRRVTPGPLPFDDASFDLVFSKEAIIHIPDKQALAADIRRLLRPGGRFVASDWLAGYQGEPSKAMRDYLVAEGLDFGLANAAQYQAALEGAGLVEVVIRDRNDWYRGVAREELARLSGSLYESLSASLGADYVDAQIDTWEKMIAALDEGALRPSHLFARAPD